MAPSKSTGGWTFPIECLLLVPVHDTKSGLNTTLCRTQATSRLGIIHPDSSVAGSSSRSHLRSCRDKRQLSCRSIFRYLKDAGCFTKYPRFSSLPCLIASLLPLDSVRSLRAWSHSPQSFTYPPPSSHSVVDDPNFIMTTSRKPTSFILPDLVSHCQFKLSYHPNGDEVAQQSVDWLDTNCPDLNAKQRRALRGLQAGELTAYCYHTASPERLRVVSDFMNYLFHLDNISDGMMTRETDTLADVVMNALWFSDRYMPTKGQTEDELNPGKLARDFWARCIPDCGPGAQARFKETLGLFFEAVNIQACARDDGVIPDLESYIDVRRDTSGCKPCWALIEYALDIDLPDYVAEHPVIAALNQSTNDLVTWSNDIFSYNVEQSRGDTHNMIVILMTYHGHTLQSAVDYVGDLCQQTIDTFCENKTKLPSWGPEIDDMVARYVQGLQDWIVGSLHWSFQTHRYFGAEGQEVKKHRLVKLLPLESKRNSVVVPPTPRPSPCPAPSQRSIVWLEELLIEPDEYHPPLQKRGEECSGVFTLLNLFTLRVVHVFLGSLFRNFH